jgi:hypothetical protein
MLPLSLVAGKFFDPRRSRGVPSRPDKKSNDGNINHHVLLISLDIFVHKIIFLWWKDYLAVHPEARDSELTEMSFIPAIIITSFIFSPGTKSTRYILLPWYGYQNSQALDIDPVEEMDKIMEKQHVYFDPYHYLKKVTSYLFIVHSKNFYTLEKNVWPGSDGVWTKIKKI